MDESDLSIASNFIYLSMAIVVIEQDIQRIANGALRVQEPYISTLNLMLKEAFIERRELRRLIKKESIQIVKRHSNDSFTSYLFIKNHKEFKRNYFNPTIRKHVENTIHRLLIQAIAKDQQIAPLNA